MNSRFTLRVAVQTLGEIPVSGLTDGSGYQVGDVWVAISHRAGYLVLQAFDFAGEQDAEAFLPYLKRSLWSIAVKHNIAFVPEFDKRKIDYADDPVAAGRNIAASFGMSDAGLVHGITENGGYTVYRTHHTIRFLSMGKAHGHVSTSVDRIVEALAKGAAAAPTDADQDDKFGTALDLYVGSFYETTIRARFLTLTTILEVLAPAIAKHVVAQELLSELRGKVGARLPAAKDEDERDALEALQRELDFRQEQSIRRRVRRLILDQSILDDAARSSWAKDVVRAYDYRSKVTHTGTIDDAQLHNSFEIAFNTVKVILMARLGVLEPGDEKIVVRGNQ